MQTVFTHDTIWLLFGLLGVILLIFNITKMHNFTIEVTPAVFVFGILMIICGPVVFLGILLWVLMDVLFVSFATKVLFTIPKRKDK